MSVNYLFCIAFRISLSGKTIIFSIHQPRYSIFKLFESLTLLAAGRLVYHGQADKVLPYFISLGEFSYDTFIRTCLAQYKKILHKCHFVAKKDKQNPKHSSVQKSQ